MSPLGHTITSISIGITSSMYFAKDYYEGTVVELFIHALKWIVEGLITDNIATTPKAFLSIFFFFGFIAGSSAPNWFEPRYLSLNEGLKFYRNRTLWHTPWLWSLALIPAFYWTIIPKYSFFEFANWGVIGFLFGGLLHIFIDMFSIGGIPLIFPNGNKFSLGVYATRSFQEIYILIPIISIPFLYTYLR
jgi:hypothetical protein